MVTKTVMVLMAMVEVAGFGCARPNRNRARKKCQTHVNTDSNTLRPPTGDILKVE